MFKMKECTNMNHTKLYNYLSGINRLKQGFFIYRERGIFRICIGMLAVFVEIRSTANFIHVPDSLIDITDHFPAPYC